MARAMGDDHMEDRKAEIPGLDENVIRRIHEAELFTEKFDSFTKSDYELLMFTAYLDSLDPPVRDYDISIALGMKESKVRNLREKSQLHYPRELNWVEELSSSIEHGYYDGEQGLVIITFEDPSVQSLIKNKIEEKFGTVGRSLNAKQLVLPIEGYIMLAACAEEDEQKALSKLDEMIKRETLGKRKVKERKLSYKFLDAVPDAVSFINDLLSLFGTGGAILQPLLQLIS